MYHYTPLVRGERSGLYDTEDVKDTTGVSAQQWYIVSQKIKAAANASESIR